MINTSNYRLEKIYTEKKGSLIAAYLFPFNKLRHGFCCKHCVQLWLSFI